MLEPTPASCSMNTSWSWRTSSWTPAGVIATRYSLFLTSRGMPTFTRPRVVHQLRRRRSAYRGGMKWYADSPGRRTTQIVADVFLLCFVAVCVWLGSVVHDGIATLRGPADGLTSAGDSFRDNMTG